jgi:hypothetical protein
MKYKIAQSRQNIKKPSAFGDPGIEPGLHAPEACVLPVY